MFSRKKKKKASDISLFSQSTLLYKGSVLEIPLTEDTIIQNSILFFDDSDPCYIHRGAVRARLTSELETELISGSEFQNFEKLEQLTGFPQIDRIEYDSSAFVKK